MVCEAPWCTTPFEPHPTARGRQKFCSDTCRARVGNARKVERRAKRSKWPKEWELTKPWARGAQVR